MGFYGIAIGLGFFGLILMAVSMRKRALPSRQLSEGLRNINALPNLNAEATAQAPRSSKVGPVGQFAAGLLLCMAALGIVVFLAGKPRIPLSVQPKILGLWRWNHGSVEHYTPDGQVVAIRHGKDFWGGTWNVADARLTISNVWVNGVLASAGKLYQIEVLTEDTMTVTEISTVTQKTYLASRIKEENLDKDEKVGIRSLRDGPKSPSAAREQSKEAFSFVSAHNYENAIRLFEGIFYRFPRLIINGNNAAYNLACTYALSGNKDQACLWLQKAIEFGFSSYGHIKTDPDLDSIRSDPRYTHLMKGH